MDGAFGCVVCGPFDTSSMQGSVGEARGGAMASVSGVAAGLRRVDCLLPCWEGLPGAGLADLRKSVPLWGP